MASMVYRVHILFTAAVNRNHFLNPLHELKFCLWILGSFFVIILAEGLELLSQTIFEKRFEIFTAVEIHILIFTYMTLYSLNMEGLYLLPRYWNPLTRPHGVVINKTATRTFFKTGYRKILYEGIATVCHLEDMCVHSP